MPPLALRRRTLVQALASAIAAPVVFAGCSSVPTGDGETVSSPRPTFADPSGPLLIKYGHDVLSAAQMHTESARIAGLPFDGYVVHLPGISGSVFSRVRGAETDLRSGADIPEMGQASHNFARIVLISGSEIQWADDALWVSIAANFRDLAAALKNSGRPWDGIFLDLEWYGNPAPNPFNYGATTAAWMYSQTAGALPGMTVERACALAQSRGAQVMEAAISGWGGVKIITTLGPWVSDPQTARELAVAGVVWNDVSWANELIAPFTVGMSEATAGTSATWIDGSEIYGASTETEFRVVSKWVREGWALQDRTVLADDDRHAFIARSSAALPVYDKSGPLNSPRSASELGDVVNSAMRETSRYVWLYTEAYDWMPGSSGTAIVPGRYLVAVEDARADAQGR